MDNEIISFREYKDSDLNEVLDLWGHFSGWGRPDESEFNKWLSGPFGKAIIFLATDKSGKIVGQVFYTPTLIYLKGIEISAVKISAPIIHEEYRSSLMDKSRSLVISLFLKGNEFIKEKGYDWLYAFPAVGWDKIMKMSQRSGSSPWKTHLYDCYEIMNNTSINTKYKLQILNCLPSEIGSIWKQFKEKNKNKSFITRDIKWLNFKWGDDLIIGIYNPHSALIGYAVIKRNTGLILDFIMLISKDIPGVISDLKRLFDEISENKEVLNPGLKFMQTEYFKLNLKGVKIKPLDFQFVFGLSALANYDFLDNINLNEWYVFPND